MVHDRPAPRFEHRGRLRDLEYELGHLRGVDRDQFARMIPRLEAPEDGHDALSAGWAWRASPGVGEFVDGPGEVQFSSTHHTKRGAEKFIFVSTIVIAVLFTISALISLIFS